MTKKLKVKIFANVNSLCNFINQNGISQKNIQAITSVCVNNNAYDTLYYWEITE